jgi:hypothetical protein
MAGTRVPKGVLLDGAQMLLASLTAGTLGFLKERGIPPDDFVRYLGGKFEDSWEGLAGRGLDEVLEHVAALDAMPMGVDAVTLKQRGDAWELVLTPVPSRKVLAKFGTTPKELLDGFGVTPAEYSSIYGMFEAPAAAIGIKFSHRASRTRHVLRLERVRKAGQARKPRQPAVRAMRK